MVFYSLALTLALVLSSPWWIFRMLTTQRYREGLRERLGFVPAHLRAAAAHKRVLWLHAVSVGEVLAATRLVSDLEAALGEGWLIAVSTTTRTGQQLARERFGADRVFYMPLDFAFAVRAYMRALKPAAVILMESELWPRLVHECQRRNIPTIVANARMSDRSFARAMKFKSIWAGVLCKVTLFLAQSETDAQRLNALGATNGRSIGNLKYDSPAPQRSWVTDLIHREIIGHPVILAGSTVGIGKEDEELNVISAWRNIAGESSLILAPRHPERFEHVRNLPVDYRTVSATELTTGVRSRNVFGSILQLHETWPEVIILDTVGDLASTYELATIAFVGGSLVAKGGHNPLEPARFGVPVVMGSSFENFRDIVATMSAHKAICVVEDDVELEHVFNRLLKNPDEARAMGERGRQVFESQQGATARAVEAILALVNS